MPLFKTAPAIPSGYNPAKHSPRALMMKVVASQPKVSPIKYQTRSPIKVKSPQKSASKSASQSPARKSVSRSPSKSPVRTSPRKKVAEPAVPLLKQFANYDDESSSDSQSDQDVLEMTKSPERSPPVKYVPF
jgi:hypothetical protein